ncbi:MAG: dihydropteroate synthase [Chitinophagaceae bacterium]|nr:dihydropteroate synthase [Chitinophagaceae bacterium]
MFTLNCRGRLLTMEKPVVMGVINLTPDSFYEKSRTAGTDEALQKAEEMLNAGAMILDIGGQSTRPGSERISEDEELRRVIEPLSAIHRRFPEALLSVDTFYSRVAREAVAAGASLINDISAGKADLMMVDTVAELNVPYVLMHMKGTPQEMHLHTDYEDIVREILDFFIEEKDKLQTKGIHDIIIDPGIGFSKTIEQNFTLIRHLPAFKMLDCPILLGVSRKSFIWKTLQSNPADEITLTGTTVLNTIGILNGASILRVHDVKEAMAVIQLTETFMKG